MDVLHRSVLELTFLILYTVRGECIFHDTNEFAGLTIRPCLFTGCDICRQDERDTNVFTTWWVCKCDKMCPLFGDCCWDYFKKCESLTNTADVVKYIQSIREDLPPRRVTAAFKLRKYGKCINVRDKRGYFSIGFYAVSMCPEDYRDESVRSRCENSTLAIPMDIPVANRWNLEEVYSNLFCAMCHNLEARNTIFWKVSILCSLHIGSTDLEAIRTKYSDTNCFTAAEEEMKFRLRTCYILYPNRCSTDTNSTLHATNITLTLPEAKSLCDSYISPVAYNGVKLANPHCSICSFDSTEYKLVHCLQSTNRDERLWLQNSTEYIVDISLLNNTLTLTNSDSKVDIPVVFCSKNERYNSLLDRCDPISCSGPSIILLPNGLCGPVLTAGLLHQTKGQLRVITDVETVVWNQDNYKVFTDRILTEFKNIADEYTNHQMNMAISVISQEHGNRVVKKSGLSIWVIGVWKYSIEISITSDLTFSETLSLLDVFYGNVAYTKNPNTFFSYTVRKMTAINYKNQEFDCINETTVVLKNIPLFFENDMIFTYDALSDSYIDLEYVPSVFVWSDTHADMEIESIVIYKNIFPNCETFKLHNDEFKQTADGKLHIFSKEHELVIEVGQFSLVNETAYICTQSFMKQWKQNDTNLTTNRTRYRLYHVIASSVCVASLTLLLIILIAYKEQGTRYQKLVLFLTCMLMLAYSLELCILLDKSSTTTIVSAMLHFVWLQSFFILGLMAIDLIQEAIKVANSPNSGRFFVSGVFISVGASTLVIVCCIVLDVRFVNDLRIGYGHGQTIWWIASPRPVIIFVVVPISVTVLFNVVSVLFLMCRRHSSNTAKQGCNTKTGYHYRSFIQSNLILSITWMMGVTSDVTNDSNISMVFYTLTAFVGVFFLWSYGLQWVFCYEGRTHTPRNYQLQFIPPASASTSNQILVHADRSSDLGAGCSSAVENSPKM